MDTLGMILSIIIIFALYTGIDSCNKGSETVTLFNSMELDILCAK